MKYIVLSFDDNTVHDRKAVEILNKYRIKGTFFINSGTLNTPGFITKEEMEKLYKGHEVGSHTVNHPKLKELTKDDVEYQIIRDIKAIEAYSGQKVYGFAYPFGEYTKTHRKIVENTPIVYARTVKGTKEFSKPADFYEWHPTMHFSGLAWDSGDRERRNRGVAFMLSKLEEFLDSPYEGVMHIWMHAWEFKDDRFKWDQLERLCRIIAQEDDLESVTAYQYYKRMN